MDFLRNLVRVALTVAVAYLAADLTAVAARHNLRPEPRPIRPLTVAAEPSGSPDRAGRNLSYALSAHRPEPAEIPFVAETPEPEPSPETEPVVVEVGDPEARPPEPALPGADGLTFSLKGVLSGSDMRIAVIEKNGETFFVREGEKFEGFRLVQVEPLAVTLDDGSQRRLLMLEAAGGP
ncbi:MAG: hypothetical protein HY319_21850 [Armatimonadetes bacterium]|nr:hypothetical protein [Armatimonadota bacterium]